MSIPALEFRLPWALKFDDAPLESYSVLNATQSDDIVVGRAREDIQGAATFLGKAAESGYFNKKVWLDLQGAHAVYVMGKRRGGKSHTLAIMCEGLASASWITVVASRQAIVVFDSMNVFLTMDTANPERLKSAPEDAEWELPAEVPPIQILKPGGTPDIVSRPIGDVHLGGHDLSAEEWIQLFGVDQYADVLGHLIYDAYDQVRHSGYRTSSGRVPPKEQFGPADLETCIERSTELVAFRDDTRMAAIRRFRTLAKNSLFNGIGLNMREILRPGTITVLLLRDLPPETRELLVAVLVRRIMEGRSETEHYERLVSVQSDGETVRSAEWQERIDTGIPRCWLVIDEAHNYIPNGRTAISKRPLKKLIDEGRNLGISVVAATQQPSGLDSAIQRNADILLIHPMTMEEDIRAAAAMLNTLWPKRSAIAKGGSLRSCDFFQAVRSLPRGYAILSSETIPRVLPVRIRPRLTYSGDRGY
jgi:DNA helicase HerA-like ATPase